FQWGTIPPRHASFAVAAGQDASAMHDGLAAEKETKFDELVEVNCYCGSVQFSRSTSPVRYSEPVIRIRGGGSRSSLRAASSASVRLSRVVAERPIARAVSANLAALGA